MKSKLKREDPTYLAKLILKNLYQEAKSRGEELWPDEAFKKFQASMIKAIEVEKINTTLVLAAYRNFDPHEVAREIHHFSVDLFYDTYIKKSRGAGRKPLSDDYLSYVLKLREEDRLSYGRMVIKLEMPHGTEEEKIKSKDVIRHQVKTARRKRPSK